MTTTEHSRSHVTESSPAREHAQNRCAGRGRRRRMVLTHMSADMLRYLDQVRYETAHDGLTPHV
jgi:hypothetical protein